jgi:hypothetical protein
LSIYFLHIPKTGGVSICVWLKEQFGEERTCPAYLWDHIVAYEREQLCRFELFCGHFGADLEAFLECQVRMITVLRDPILRTISHYNHVYRDANHPMHDRVAGQSLDQFVRDRQNWPMIENFQARYLVRSPIKFLQFKACLDRSVTKTNRLSVLSEDARFLFDPIYVREKSREVLEQDFDVVGSTEHLPEFLCDVAQQFSLTPPLSASVPFLNAASRPAHDMDVAPETLDIIRELTQLDHDLWEWCRQSPRRPDSVRAV